MQGWASTPICFKVEKVMSEPILKEANSVEFLQELND